MRVGFLGLGLGGPIPHRADLLLLPDTVFPVPQLPGAPRLRFNNVRSQVFLLSSERTDDDDSELTTGFDRRVESKSLCRSLHTLRLVPESA